MLLNLIGISSVRDTFEVLDHMTDMWIFTTISRAFSSSSYSEVHEPDPYWELKVRERTLSGSYFFANKSQIFFCLQRKQNGIENVNGLLRF